MREKQFTGQQKNPYLPFDVQIKNIIELNEESRSYILDSPNINDIHYEPGQFFCLSVYGVGEAVFGVTDTIYEDGIEIAVRNTGGLVTSMIHKVNIGSTVGLRGPYGTGFPMDDFKGKNMIFICAGIGFWPVRSAIKHVLSNRDDYGKITIITGVREPCLHSYVEDLEEWKNRDDINLLRTVDGCVDEDDWDENVGLITVLTDKLEVDNPEEWAVICCGPPVAFKFIGMSLNGRGFHDDQIFVSLERRMKCGIGKCNNCLIAGTTYVCREGPVFTLGEVKNMSGGLD